MCNIKSFFNSSLIICCSLIASVIASFHYVFVRFDLLKISNNVQNSPLGVYKRFFPRYRVHVMRAIITLLLKTPLRNLVLNLVNFNIPHFPNSGCIIVTCHTQWEGLLVQSCIDKNYGLIIGRRKWKNNKKKIQRKGNGYTNLRKIIRFLHENGRIIIAADSFNKLNDCTVKYRGKTLNASELPIRPANLASVPLIIALPVLNNKMVEFVVGPEFNTKEFNEDVTAITQQIISFIDDQLKSDYRIWSSLGR